MKRNIGTVCMMLGTVLVLAALVLALHNHRESRAAAEAAQAALVQIAAHIEELPSTTDTAPGPADPLQPYLDPIDPTMKEVEIDGYSYVGYVSIPALGLELPVMSDWSDSQLRRSPCRYCGSTKTDDLVVMAHNYVQHFGSLNKMQPGDLVYFTDMDGKIISYQVVVVDILDPKAVEDMTAGEYDLTLFTCTYASQSRVTVRCDRTEP